MRKNAARVAQQIKGETDTLEERWPELKDRVGRWQKIVEDALGVRIEKKKIVFVSVDPVVFFFLQKMTLFDKSVQDCEQGLSEAEQTKRQWQQVKDLKLDDLPNQMELARVRKILNNFCIYR